MLRINDLSLQYRRRTLRPFYAHTQATSYNGVLSANFDRTVGQLGVTGSQSAINAGSVAVHLVGDVFTLYGSNEGTGADTATDASARAWGLFAQHVGGNIDDLRGRSEIAIWRGIGSVWEVLAPAFNDTGLASPAAAEVGTGATEVYLNSGTDGRLVKSTGANSTLTFIGGANQPVARLIQRLSANAIKIELLV